VGVWAVNPQLLDGAWIASASALAELLADYELTADIARVYGRIEELRWRLRTRTETRVNTLDTMTIALVDELGPEVDALLPRIDVEIENPSLRLGGIVQRAGIDSVLNIRGRIDPKIVVRKKES
jgi:hypothetical protein